MQLGRILARWKPQIWRSIRRLKKRKLLIKDMISNLESELIPDLDA